MERKNLDNVFLGIRTILCLARKCSSVNRKEAGMKNKTWIFFFIVIFILFSVSTFAETKKLRQIGRYKLVDIKGDIPHEELMKIIVDKYQGDIKYGFDLVGSGDLFAPFIEQIKQSAFREKELAVGENISWMLFRSQGKVKAVYDLEWAGGEPLSVFSFSVEKGNKHYEFIMPKTCGNISLLGIKEAGPGVVGDLERTAEERAQAERELGLEEEQEYAIEKAKIYQEIYPLLSETDLYCSFFVLDDKRPEMRIIGAEREYERIQFNNGDIVYINQGRNDGIEEGQIFLVLEVGTVTTEYGPLAFKRGRLRVVALEENTSSARVEKACGPIMLGNYLVPFEEKETRMGKDLGYDVPPYEGVGLRGRLIYLQRDFFQIGTGAWGLINLGESDGLQIGQQLVVYKKFYDDTPLLVFANIVVIDTQKRTSTVKVLSCKDALVIGDLVQTRNN